MLFFVDVDAQSHIPKYLKLWVRLVTLFPAKTALNNVLWL